MFEQLADWLEARTGYRGLLHEALYEPIPGGARWRYVFGSALTATFAIQLFTGLLLMASYSPSATTAWGSVYYISFESGWGGWLIRGIHHFGSQAMVVLLVLHLCQVLLAGAYRAPREVNWWFGIALMLVTLGFSLTGYLLPWDQKGYWATKVATKIAGGTPVLGPYIYKLIVGGTDYGNQTLTRFYALHVGVLPALLIACLAVHVALFRRHGVTAPRETRGIVETFWPKQVLMDLVASAIVFGLLVFLVVHEGGANLDAPADPSSGDYPARPEWYFLSLFQMLKLFPGELEVVGTIIVPGAILAVLLFLPLLDRVIPAARLAHFLACAVVFTLVGGASYLTYAAIVEDQTNQKFQTDRRRASEAAERARLLAGSPEVGIPPDGAGYLLRRDPLYNGSRVLEAKCLSCHYYGGKGQVTRVEAEVKPEELGGVEVGVKTRTGSIPRVVHEALALKAKEFSPTASGEPVTEEGAIVGYRFQGKNAKGETVEARVDARGRSVVTETISRQTAADLKHFGSRAWLRGLLENPGAPAYFENVPQAGGMKRWKKKSKLTAEELDAIADFFAEHVITTKEEMSPSEWEEQEAVQNHPGYAAFQKECATCHADWSAPNPEAPNLFGWGSPWWIARMIKRPGSPHLYGYLEESERMPAFADRLSDNDLQTVVRLLKDDYLGAQGPPPGGQGSH
ncbi:MAG: cytochrome b N-terminal domain-containing protein [Isosphaeraceae bacterium]|nr:cytochrome b N-terminal domain-containing protein [Isosphaeraceae bacterium]